MSIFMQHVRVYCMPDIYWRTCMVPLDTTVFPCWTPTTTGFFSLVLKKMGSQNYPLVEILSPVTPKKTLTSQ